MRALLALALLGCGEPEQEPAEAVDDPRLADEVLWAPGAGDGPFRDPALAVNGVFGGGERQGSTDVFSLARDGDEAGLALGWGGASVIDGPGVDLVVFENPFEHDSGRFMDPVVVEVSADGQSWTAFPHDYLAADEQAWSADPADWQGFAGLTPVSFSEGDGLDPLDPDEAGGDGFDLADLGLDEVCCVRLWSASEWENPDTGAPYPRHPIGDGADIDGVYGRVD